MTKIVKEKKVKEPKKKVQKPIDAPKLHQPEPDVVGELATPTIPTSNTISSAPVQSDKKYYYQGNEIVKVFEDRTKGSAILCQVKDPGGNTLKMYIPTKDLDKAMKADQE